MRMAMTAFYQEDLAYIHAAAFEGLARGAAPEIVRRLREAALPVRRVIDAGCGAGPLTRALTDAGFEVTGIDASAELLVIAQAAVPSARFVHASIYETPIPPCEAIVAVGEPLTYHAPDVDADRRVMDFFRRASRALPQGGLLIFDIIETGEPSLAGRFWASSTDWAVLSETMEDRRMLSRRIETFRAAGDLYRRGRELHHVRLFDSGELRDRLISCGFAVETAAAYGVQPLAVRRRAFFATRC